MPTRKEFLQKSLCLAGLPLLESLPVSLLTSCSSPQTQYWFDLHCHTAGFIFKGTANYPGDDAFASAVDQMNAANLNGVFLSIVSDIPILAITDRGVITSRPFNPGEAWGEYRRQLDIINELMPVSSAEVATTHNDLLGENVGMMLACEGADFLEGEVDRVDQAYADGVRSIQLVHYTQNDIGDIQTAPAQHQGLSDFGKAIVKRMNELRMVIDVAHASFETVQDVAELATTPLILSHSLLRGDTTSPVTNRTINREHATLIAETGGVIGVWPSGYSKDMDEFIDNTFRLIDAAGIDHVGMGTDMDANFKPVVGNYQEFIQWADALAERGLSNEEVSKLTGGNAMRVIKEVLG